MAGLGVVAAKEVQINQKKPTRGLYPSGPTIASTNFWVKLVDNARPAVVNLRLLSPFDGPSLRSTQAAPVVIASCIRRDEKGSQLQRRITFVYDLVLLAWQDP